MESTTLALALTLFPSMDHREIGVGTYGFETAAAPQLSDALAPQGLEINYRRLYDSEEALIDDDDYAAGHDAVLRMYRGADGQVVLDRLEFNTLLMSLRVRPELGDAFDLGLLGGRWEHTYWFGDTGWSQWRVYTPSSFTLVGMSNSDMGIDKLRYYFGGGTGLGGEFLTRVAGPIGLQLRAEAEGDARRRRENTAQLHHSARYELGLKGEAGLVFLAEKQAWILGGWAEHITQWMPADGTSGVDRQYFAAGARLSGRFYKEPEASPTDDMDLELDQLLDSLRQQDLESVEEEDMSEDVSEEGSDQEPAEEEAQASYLPLEVHWSEIEFVDQKLPEWPQNARDNATCSLRFFVDTTGVPYDIRPEECDTDLLGPTMEAAWAWRIRPITQSNDTVSAQFVYTLSRMDLQ